MNESTKQQIETMLPLLNQRQRRLFLASETKALGFGGISEVSRMSRVSQMTITLGIKELDESKKETLQAGHCRRRKETYNGPIP